MIWDSPGRFLRSAILAYFQPCPAVKVQNISPDLRLGSYHVSDCSIASPTEAMARQYLAGSGASDGTDFHYRQSRARVCQGHEFQRSRMLI